ncbi:MAG: ATP-binding protein [Proteobacteria bacterium]|nr:ATP-binding protein [Pseudomonadota bacterium]
MDNDGAIDDGWEVLGYEAPTTPDTFEPEEYADAPAPRERTATERAKSGPTQGTELVQLARSRYDVLRGDDGKTYAVARDMPGVAFGLRNSGGLRQRLAADFFDDKNRAASSSALSDALSVLEGNAMRADERRIHLRAGRDGSAVIVDRATPGGQVVRVYPGGWDLLERSPILFRRTNMSLEMPAPISGGNLDGLRSLLNVDDRAFRLIIAFIVAAFLPDIAHPILALRGQQGSAKSTAARTILSFIDPSAASLQSQPHTADNWAVAAYNVYGIGLDNVSRMLGWLQDALCKAVTGDVWVRRQLYTDDGLSALQFRRPIVLTSIDPGALQGDLADRILTIELAPIAPADRKTDSELDEKLSALRATTLGAIFDLLAGVLAHLPTIALGEKPRMADFALVLAAVDQVTGWTTLPDYLASTTTAAREVVEGNAFAAAILDLATKWGQWQGTPGDLLAVLGDDKHARDWPGTPAAVGGNLSRMTPGLGAAGVEVTRGARRTNRGWRYTIRSLAAVLCADCGLPLPDVVTATGAKSHPTCQEPF